MLIHDPRPQVAMQCEFCDSELPDVEPENLALLQHVAANEPCHEQFDFLLENLNASWTPAMSGG
jgi:hypothetical protein